MNLRKIAFVLTFALILLLAACASQDGRGPAFDLTGEWTLSSINGQEPLEGMSFNTAFENGEVVGQACNSFGGQYSVDGQSLAISNLIQTKMACLEPEGIMQQESAYMQALSQAASFLGSGDQLEIKNAAGETILTFLRAQ